MKCNLIFPVLLSYNIILFQIVATDFQDESLYDILGVDQTATAKTIKQAYKQLAREWHPDKNKSPGANEKFIKINEAYETLGDSERRRKYDMFGKTSADTESRQGFSGFHPFEEFQFQFSDMKYKINLWTYQNVMIKESHKKPYIIYIYSTFCFRCIGTNPIWKDFVNDLEKIGAGIAEVNADSSPSLMDIFGVDRLPSVMALIRGRLVHYHWSEFSVKRLREFVGSLLPSNLIITLSDSSFNSFVSDWSDNKVKVVMFDTRNQPGLRFMLAAFSHREHFKFGFYHLGREPITNQILVQRYRIDRGDENFVIIKEDYKAPVVHVVASQISREKMDRLMSQHKYLHLPRVSSPSIFDHLCPFTPQYRSKRVCALLILRGPSTLPIDESFLSSFRSAALNLNQSESPRYDRVKFGYLYESSQVELIGSMKDVNDRNNKSSDNRKVIILWRNTREGLRYQYLSGGWGGHHSEEELATILVSCLSASSYGHGVDRTPAIVDEFAEGIIARCTNAIMEFYDLIYQLLPMPFLMISLLFSILLVYVATKITILFQKTFAKPSPSSSTSSIPGDGAGGDYDDDCTTESFSDETEPDLGKSHLETRGSNEGSKGLRLCSIRPMDGSTYDRYITKGEKGWRNVVLLLNDQNFEQSAKIVKKFEAMVKPYDSPHFRFHFSYLYLTKPHVYWCKNVARSTELPHNLRDLERMGVLDLSGASNELVHGFVLAINSTGSYYHIFLNFEHRGRYGTDSNDGDFLGLDDKCEEDSYNRRREPGGRGRAANVLDGFDIWLDKLYEGTLPKIPVSDWPSRLDLY